jgi:hypothetical protein
MDAVKTIEALGGLSATARALGLTVSTVQYWRDTKKIPKWRLESVARALAEHPDAYKPKPRRRSKKEAA